MVEFNEENVKMMSHQAKGRTILSMSLERSADDFLIITFMDGARLRIRYDYIWDLEIIEWLPRKKTKEAS